MVSATCPGCGAALELPDRLAGCPVRCSHCRHEFTVPDVAEAELADEGAASGRPRRRPAMAESYDDVRRPRRKGHPILLTCGIVAGVMFLVCGGGGVAFYFLFIHETEEPVTPADRGMVVTAERLREFVPTLKADPAKGKIRKVRKLDGSRELTYEYDGTDNSDENTLYINDTVGVERSNDAASGAYTGLDIGTNIGFRLSGEGKLRQVERKDLWSWGDTSKCVLLMNGDKKVGNVFMARKGRRYFLLTIVGVYFEDAGAIRDLLAPIVQRLDNYDG